MTFPEAVTTVLRSSGVWKMPESSAAGIDSSKDGFGALSAVCFSGSRPSLSKEGSENSSISSSVLVSRLTKTSSSTRGREREMSSSKGTSSSSAAKLVGGAAIFPTKMSAGSGIWIFSCACMAAAGSFSVSGASIAGSSRSVSGVSSMTAVCTSFDRSVEFKLTP